MIAQFSDSAPTGNGGFKAANSGRRMEQFVGGQIRDCGYQLVKPKGFATRRSELQPIYAKQHLVKPGIYGSDRKADFIIHHPKKWPNGLVLEVKWQRRQGSVDEKFPYLVECINVSGYDTIVILDGGGYRPAAEQWLRGQVGKGRLKNVLNMADFMGFANDGKL